MMKIGFIGLGQMGKHIALNLLKSGAELTVIDTRADSFLEFEKRGAKTSTNLLEIVPADIIFLCLPDSNVVHKVLLGENGIIHHLRKGQIIVDFSTIKYTTTLEIAKSLEEKGVKFLDAPVSGMEARAMEGTLTVMCGGKKEVYAEMIPYLECMGTKILYMGDTGSGQLTKLINQLLFDINVAALAEVLPMSVKMGLDPENVGEVVNSGTGKSYASEFFIPRILKDSFVDGYPLKNAYKDLISAAEIGANLCIPMPVLSAATTTYQMALLKGHGEKDKGSMIAVFEDLLEVSYRS
ncbi:NAD(P)-dependent oxidoreductase [Desulfosporosinus shakirovi]|uniref:NAD(P)-dependent oxidoreductase n=1 Tax=Desulfosporosinus shakirovi TaxID=2885154 RepID=UPI001E3C2B4F|nr:NAD(P)-dependent oxidoreductase [Desulfosporosinus sp. SRJS8]MCB8815149.1 NAD(P)-dependent oxidoreductase [Desulfosporosinus sp. SRJS8]